MVGGVRCAASQRIVYIACMGLDIDFVDMIMTFDFRKTDIVA